MDYLFFLKCKNAYLNGGNIMDLVAKSYPNNRSLAIEIAYDLQAGTYIKEFQENQEAKRKYTNEGGGYLEKYFNKDSIMLNVGAGELWTISLMLDAIKTKQQRVYNLEISWSRINKGCKFWNSIHKNSINMSPFVADMLEIPLPSKSVDVVTSSHALEPNGCQLENILSELFRITKDKCVLFEPCYEIATEEGKKRMDKLGYIKNITESVNKLGGTVEDIIPLLKTQTMINPTACFVITPPSILKPTDNIDNFTVPGTDIPVEINNDCYYSIDTGLAFPILGGIPILKSESAILASKYHEEE